MLDVSKGYRLIFSELTDGIKAEGVGLGLSPCAWNALCCYEAIFPMQDTDREVMVMPVLLYSAEVDMASNTEGHPKTDDFPDAMPTGHPRPHSVGQMP